MESIPGCCVLSILIGMGSRVASTLTCSRRSTRSQFPVRGKSFYRLSAEDQRSRLWSKGGPAADADGTIPLRPNIDDNVFAQSKGATTCEFKRSWNLGGSP